MATRDIDTVNIAGLPISQVKGYGYLYNSYAYRLANFAPANWRVPTKTDLDTLVSNVGLYSKLKSTRIYPTYDNGWVTPGTNDSNFSLLPAGCRANNAYIGATTAAYIASITLSGEGVYALFCTTSMYTALAILHGGYSVRLIMDNISGWTEGNTITDIDGNIYDTIKIGSQVWIASNWKCTKLNDSTPIALNSGNTYDWSYTTIPQYCSYNNLPLIEE